MFIVTIVSINETNSIQRIRLTFQEDILCLELAS